MAPNEGPLTQMARALQDRDRQFQLRLMNAMRTIASNPAAALAEYQWAEAEYAALERDRRQFENAMDTQSAQAGIPPSAQQAAVRKSMADTSEDSRIQIECGKAQALILLGRFSEARAVVDRASSSLTPNASLQAKSMLLQLRGSLIGFGL